MKTWICALVTVTAAALAAQAEQDIFGPVRCTAEAVEDAAAQGATYGELIDRINDKIEAEAPLVFCAVATSDAPGRGLLPFLPWKERSVAELTWKVEAQPPLVTYFSERRGVLGGWNMTDNSPTYLLFDPDRPEVLSHLFHQMEFRIGEDAVFYAITTGP